jgi:2-amino-4-hydroxy-6-hydroxymethyldihydropteridine diphosphokinase
MATCLIGLGANLGDSAATLASAARQLAAHPDIEHCRLSRAYFTAPAGGPSDQPQFINAAMRLETKLSASHLWQLLQKLESAHGRQRHERWGPRTLDLDLLLYDELVQTGPVLTLPHPRMAFRRFVLEPAVEVAEDMLHPPTGLLIAELLEQLNTSASVIVLVGQTFAWRKAVMRAACNQVLAGGTNCVVFTKDASQSAFPSLTVAEEVWQISDCWPITTLKQSTDAQLPKLVVTLTAAEAVERIDEVLAAVPPRVPRLVLGGAAIDNVVEELAAAVSAMRRQKFQVQPFPGLP